MKRSEITSALRKAAIGYLVKKGFGANAELGIIPWGKRKVDVIGVTMRGHIVIMEIKSCVADFTTDSKWHTYLDYCHQFYLVFTEKTWKSIAKSYTFSGVGVMVLDSKTGFLRAVKSCPRYEVQEDVHRSLILRLAWRNAIFSKRTTRRNRVFLT